MKNTVLSLYALLCLGTGIAKAQFTTILSFNGTNGAYPQGSLTVSPSGDTLYGMTANGGANSEGTIFAINTNGAHYADLLDFTDSSGSANGTIGNLTLSGHTLYGITVAGINWSANDGHVFSLNINGNTYTHLIDFNFMNGRNPWASLMFCGGILYETSYMGDTNYKGNIFSISNNGNVYTGIHNFENDTRDSASPLGSFALSGNVLYGMTECGGIYGHGNIFSVNTDGSGYKDLYDFNDIIDDNPRGSLTLSGNTLYGMTRYTGGWGNGYGCIFSINTDGTGYTVLHHFNGTDGANPVGDLALSGNILYGMTPYGGTNNYGTIFSINTDGSGYKNLYSFNGTNGKYPMGNLTLSANILYGMTEFGGANNDGIIFGYDLNPTTKAVTDSTSTINAATDLSDSSNPSIETQNMENITKVNVYPNPSNGTFILEWSDVIGQSSVVQISIIDDIGQQVYAEQKQVESGYAKEEFHLENLATGMYFIRIQTNSGITVHKLVIAHNR